MIFMAPFIRKFLGLKFQQQTPVWPFVSDFHCADRKLALETDRGQPVESRRDQARDGILAAQGIRILRFWNSGNHTNLPGVPQRIAEEAER